MSIARKRPLSLNGSWRLAYAPHSQVQGKPYPTSKAEIAESGLPVIDGEVPGNFELDMCRQGLLDDPYYGLNVMKMQELECLHLWYFRSFSYEGGDGETRLVFEGIDTFAEIYLNGRLIGKTNNMLIEHRLEPEGLLVGENELVIHILPVMIEARDLPTEPGYAALPYNYGGLRVRKAPHMFGWDILPRILSGGLWRDVYLETIPSQRVEEAYVYTLGLDGDGQESQMALYYQMALTQDSTQRYAVRICGACHGSSFEAGQKLWAPCGTLSFTVPNSRLWWVKGRGEPCLYDAAVQLLLDGRVIDEKPVRFGIRTTELLRRPQSGKDDGEFCLLLNHEKIFINGTNWVAADAFHSRDKERIPRIMGLVDEIGVNMLRCWGGNVYEDHQFFDACDEMGILVWQDFAMACAVYPQDDAFCGALREEVRSVVRKLRQHPSLFLWAGDNECDVTGMVRRDPNANILTRRVIPDVLRAEDPTRPYLPSSPYVDEYDFGHGASSHVEDHLWGPRDYYKGTFYSTAPAKFASEIGYHGCPAPESAAEFLSPGALWPPSPNDEWLAHATTMDLGGCPYQFRIRLMSSQIETLFGQIPDNLNDYALASQLSQAEAMKFFIERFRMAKWEKTGIIWWNLIDGWPQFSDAVVDYYFRRKQAFYHIQRSQQPLCFMFGEKAEGKRTLAAVNDTRRDLEARFAVYDIADGKREVCRGTVRVPADSSIPVQSLGCAAENQGLYLIIWEAGEYSGVNHYLYGEPAYSLEECLGWFQEAGLLQAQGVQLPEKVGVRSA